MLIYDWSRPGEREDKMPVSPVPCCLGRGSPGALRRGSRGSSPPIPQSFTLGMPRKSPGRRPETLTLTKITDQRHHRARMNAKFQVGFAGLGPDCAAGQAASLRLPERRIAAIEFENTAKRRSFSLMKSQRSQLRRGTNGRSGPPTNYASDAKRF